MALPHDPHSTPLCLWCSLSSSIILLGRTLLGIWSHSHMKYIVHGSKIHSLWNIIYETCDFSIHQLWGKEFIYIKQRPPTTNRDQEYQLYHLSAIYNLIIPPKLQPSYMSCDRTWPRLIADGLNRRTFHKLCSKLQSKWISYKRTLHHIHSINHTYPSLCGYNYLMKSKYPAQTTLPLTLDTLFCLMTQGE